jgi:hypothetical protein
MANARSSALLAFVVALAALPAALALASCRKPEQTTPTDAIVTASAAATSAPTTSASASAAAPTAPGATTAPSAREVPVIAFDPALPPALTSPSALDGCALDTVNDKIATANTRIPKAPTLRLAGWAGDKTTGSVPPLVIVELVAGTKHFYATATRAGKRPDVAKVFGVEAFVDAGFELLASLAAVPPGTYTVKVNQIAASGAAFVCDTKHQLEIK